MLLIVSILECISALDKLINTWEFSQPLLTDICMTGRHSDRWTGRQSGKQADGFSRTVVWHPGYPTSLHYWWIAVSCLGCGGWFFFILKLGANSRIVKTPEALYLVKTGLLCDQKLYTLIQTGRVNANVHNQAYRMCFASVKHLHLPDWMWTSIHLTKWDVAVVLEISPLMWPLRVLEERKGKGSGSITTKHPYFKVRD